MWTELIEISKANANKNKQINLKELFNDVDNWGINFKKYCSEARNKFGYNSEFFKQLPIDNIIELLQKSSAANIYQFKFGLHDIYYMGNLKDFFAEDLESIKDFRKKIENITFENNPVLCKAALMYLKEEVDRIIEGLEA